MKKQVLLLFCLLMTVFSNMAFGTIINGINYSFDFPTQTASVRSKSSAEYSGAITIPSSVTYNGVTYSVTSIAREAFYKCTGLTSIYIPNSVTSIGERAFYICSGLTSIEIPNSVTSIAREAFYKCTGLTSITIPNSVTEIGEVAFKYTGWWNNQSEGLVYLSNWLLGYNNSKPEGQIKITDGTRRIANNALSNCTGLTSITIPNSVTSIGGRAFEGCSGLTSIEIPNSVTEIGSLAFSGTAWLNNQPNGVVYAGKVAYFYKGNWYANTQIQLKDGILGISPSAFSGCTGLTSITIPNSVTSIGSFAFNGCSGLTSITIPSSVTSIGDDAFQSCSGLTSIKIPNSVTSIGEATFNGCSGLTSIIVANDNPVYDSREKCNAIIETETNRLINGCQNTVIPNSVTSIGYFAFGGCSGLTSITIPNSVTSIGGSAFYNCSGLTSITIPSSVTSIGSYAFTGCSGLTSITIPNSVTSIGQNAFWRCTGLTSITLGSGVTSLYNAFDGCTNVTTLNLNCKEVGKWFASIKGTVKKISFGDEVTTISESLFEGFSALTQIYIGRGMKTIGAKAFAACDKLEDVYCYAVRYPSVAADAFENSYVDYVTLHVPAKSVNQYKAHEVWGKFMDVVPLTDEELAISNITLNETDVKDIFDLSGSHINQLKRGVNIIRTKDGKTMKVWVK